MTKHQVNDRCSVLVVGGGPVGLAMAIELGLKGIQTLLVEKGDGLVTLPKMNFVNPRSMEHCRRWGVATKVRTAGWPGDYPQDVSFRTALAGYKIAHLAFPSHDDRPTPVYTPEPSQRCPQLWFDPILRARAEALESVGLRYFTSLEGLTQDGEGVVATLKDTRSGAVRDVRARYLVGADGAGSSVRRSLDIDCEVGDLVRENLAINIRINDFFGDFGDERAAFYFVFDDKGVRSIVTPTDGKQLWRMNVRLRPGEKYDALDVEELLMEVAGRKFDHEVINTLPWRVRFTVARTFRKDRVFLVGDAAHTLSPTGGLGMNTGIEDVANLGWKLAAVIDGWAGDALLDSYHDERQPVVCRANEESRRNLERMLAFPSFRALKQEDEEGAAARAELHTTILSSGIENEWKNDGVSLGFSYDHSNVVEYNPAISRDYDPNNFTQKCAPGSRAPHLWLEGRRSTLDLFGGGLVLLCLKDDHSAAHDFGKAAVECDVPLETVSIKDRVTDRAYAGEVYPCRFVLVRPDGIVVWQGNEIPDDIHKILMNVTGRKGKS